MSLLTPPCLQPEPGGLQALMPSAVFWGGFERLQEVSRSQGDAHGQPGRASEGEALLREAALSSGSDPGALVHVTGRGASKWLCPQTQNRSVLTASRPLGPAAWLHPSSSGSFESFFPLRRDGAKNE